jgi:L,D-transpeptidase YcfS
MVKKVWSLLLLLISNSSIYAANEEYSISVCITSSLENALKCKQKLLDDSQTDIFIIKDKNSRYLTYLGLYGDENSAKYAMKSSSRYVKKQNPFIKKLPKNILTLKNKSEEFIDLSTPIKETIIQHELIKKKPEKYDDSLEFVSNNLIPEQLQLVSSYPFDEGQNLSRGSFKKEKKTIVLAKFKEEEIELQKEVEPKLQEQKSVAEEKQVERKTQQTKRIEQPKPVEEKVVETKKEEPKKVAEAVIEKPLAIQKNAIVKNQINNPEQEYEEEIKQISMEEFDKAEDEKAPKLQPIPKMNKLIKSLENNGSRRIMFKSEKKSAVVKEIKKSVDVNPLKNVAEYEEILIEVDSVKNRMTLKAKIDDEFQELKTYVVSTGKNNIEKPFGVGRISRISLNPIWYPTADTIKSFKKRGINLPNVVLPGDKYNYMGAAKINLTHEVNGKSTYRIHGTLNEKTLGTNESAGCIRMKNSDVVQLATLLNKFSALKGLDEVEVILK